MKKTIISTTMALSLFASASFADNSVPVMQMDESIIKNQTATEANPTSAAVPIIIFTLLALLASRADTPLTPA
ncbi:MAG TPA: hypothetical protein DIT67_03535 [Octadecabacter sp.]|nr:hypothetical protein [Octadecabacter sp.]